ncbi:MAG TPA: HEAT repeat domain-containing protein [Longimicrobium sp.]|nr:HEAT repeat domain-containing protein [Longimicrobium sp.]
MLSRSASALLVLLALGCGAPALAAQDTIPPPELAALPLDSLFARMTGDDPEAGRAAFMEAVRRGRPGDVAPWLRAEDGEAVPAAVYVLLRMGEPGIGVLLTELRAADERRKMQMLNVLGTSGMMEPVSPPLLAALVRDPDEALRIAGARMLQRSMYLPGDTVGDPETEALVLATLADPSGEVRAAAVSALSMPRYIRPAEVRALIGILANDPDPGVREAAALTLGSLGRAGAPAVPALIAAMGDAAAEVRQRAASALGDLGPDAADAVPVLLRAARGGDEAMRQEAVAALGGIGIDPPVQADAVLQALDEALAHEDSTTRLLAVGTLARLDARATPLLVRALRDPDARVASGAAAALAPRPATQPVVDALFAALRHPRPEVGAAAARALAGFGAAQLPRLREAARAGSAPAARAVGYVEQGERLGIAGACYAFRRGPWQPVMDLDADSTFSTPPAQVRFLAAVAEEYREDDAEQGEAWFVAERVGASAGPGWTGGMWRPVPGREALELVWSNGFSGVSLELAMEDGGTMRGTAETFWDFPRPRQTAEITAERIPCPADAAAPE